jgi:hypothetical protein
MIVLSIGMPRAGSGWFFNLTNDLLIASGFQDVRKIRERYHLQRVLTEVNCNIGAFTIPRLSAVVIPSLFGNTFCVKAHAGPTDFTLRLIRSGALLPTYIYRDPRDALLSAWEYGRRGVEQGRPNAFSDITDIDSASSFMIDYIHIWEKWNRCQQAFRCKYEDLLTSYQSQIDQMLLFLKLNPDKEGVIKVIDKFRPGGEDTGQKGLHFHKGKIGRFRQALTREQVAKLNKKFGVFLDRMGYQI